MIQDAEFSDIATLYSSAIPVFAAIGAAFLSGAFTGVWVVLRFCEVHQTRTETIGGIDMGWKTITGTVVAVLGWLCQPDVLALLPDDISKIVMGFGVIFGVYGGRHAIAKLQARLG